MDFARRRTLLAAATLLALAITAVAGGGVTYGLLSDEERSDVAIQAASDFTESPSADEVVSFRGCGQVRLRLPEDTSFSLAVTLYDSAADARETVTLTDADAGSAASGFWYDSGRNQYTFDAGAYDGSNPEGDKIVAAELDGQLVENDHRCAAVRADGNGAKGGLGTQDGPGSRGGAGASAATTTAGNAATETVGGSGTGDGDGGRDDTGNDASAPNETEAPTATESSTPAETATATETSTPAETPTATETAATATETTISSPSGTASTPEATGTTTPESKTARATTAENTTVERTTAAETTTGEEA